MAKKGRELRPGQFREEVMDRLIEQNLEEYLRGSLEPQKLAEFEARLGAADEYTRKTVSEFSKQSKMMQQTLRPTSEVEPAPGFYARVMQRIDAQRVTAWWSAFLEPAFSRRLALASLTLLMLLGITALTAPSDSGEQPAIASTPAEVIMAQPAADTVADFDEAQGRDVILGTLTTYQE